MEIPVHVSSEDITEDFPVLEHFSLANQNQKEEGYVEIGVAREDSEPNTLMYGPPTSALSRPAVLRYGIGHMLNDLTAACWFTYLLIFLTDVGLSHKQAATVMLSGQVADGLSTIAVGQLIDGYGHFKLWHAGGSALVAISFSSVFGACLPCVIFGLDSFTARTIGYCSFAAVFNTGWAATQVSHMSLVSFITGNSSSRVALNSCRNSFTMVANLCLYAIAYVAFWISPASSPEGVQYQFLWIAGASIFIGSCFVLVFLCSVDEPRSYKRHDAEGKWRASYSMWFCNLLYYQVALVYTLTRLATNVSQALLPFYLVDDLRMGESSKAVVPAVIYICSFLASIVLQELHWTSSRLKTFFTVGACLWVGAGAVILILPISFRSGVYALAGVIGIGNAFMLVTATSMESLLVGQNLTGCAFVYGSLGFFDKLACGASLYIIEALNDGTRACTLNKQGVSDCRGSLIRHSLGLVPSGCALVAATIALTARFNDTEFEYTLKKPLISRQSDTAPVPIPDSKFIRRTLAPVAPRSRGIGLLRQDCAAIHT